MGRTDSEKQLLEDAIAGDTVALAQLMVNYCEQLESHIARRIPKESQGIVNPEDIFQQTCVRAFAAVGSFSPRNEHSFYRWLTVIADNLLKDINKRRWKEGLVEGPPGNGDSFVDLVTRMALNSTTPSRDARNREIQRCLEAALATMPEDYREVIRLRYLLDQPIDEVARQMGRSPDAIRGLCHRAKKKLRAVLGRSSLYFSS